MGSSAREHGYEIKYWKKEGRTILFLCMNPEIAVSSTGGGHSVGLKSQVPPATLEFAKQIVGVRDERTGKALGAGTEFDWPMNEAVVLSFEGSVPK